MAGNLWRPEAKLTVTGGSTNPDKAAPRRPKVSVVTLSFNQGAYLERAIASVLWQDYTDVEYIVVDPGSTDGSRDILAAQSDNIDHLILEPDDGPADGLNKGFARATGDLYFYLNADDFLVTPTVFSTAAAVFDEDPTLDVVAGHGFIVDPDYRILRHYRSPPFATWRCALGSANLLQQSTLFRREAFERAGGFNAENPACWDAELNFDLGRSGAKVRVLEAYWSSFVIYPDSITGSQRLAHYLRGYRKRVYETCFGRRPGALELMVMFRLAWIVRNAADPKNLLVRLRDHLGSQKRLSPEKIPPPLAELSRSGAAKPAGIGHNGAASDSL